jgi:hypothetical protein
MVHQYLRNATVKPAKAAPAPQCLKGQIENIALSGASRRRDNFFEKSCPWDVENAPRAPTYP